MLFAKQVNGNIVKFPYTGSDLRADYPDTSFPRNLSGVDLSSWGVVKVKEMPDPPYNEKTQNLVLGEPKYVNRSWQVTKVAVAKNASEIKEVQKKEDKEALVNDQAVKNLFGARPSQIDNYIDSNVTDLESAKTLLKTISRAVAVLSQSVIS